jgi:CheY-like chemotaxis protein
VPEAKDVTILVVDDEAPLRKAIMFDFERRGFKVLGAACGNEAFEVIKNNKIQVVLSDVRMPNGDGVELLDKIKAIDPEIPVVMFITGFADLTSEDAYNKGADAIFAKPFDRKELIGSVIRALKSKQEQWGVKESERIETTFDIKLSFPGLSSAINGKVLNLGRGGMFIALAGQIPAVSAKAKFHIEFEEGSPRKIEGYGIVRWVRGQSLEQSSRGCGIEFEYLSDETRDQVIDAIKLAKPKAFIPKT